MSSNDPMEVFTLPETWRPSVMNAIKKQDEHEQRRLLTPDVRNAIVRDFVTSMYACTTKPDKAFCTHVAMALVKQNSFMRDVGTGVSGYVSFCIVVRLLNVVPQYVLTNECLHGVHLITHALCESHRFFVIIFFM